MSNPYSLNEDYAARLRPFFRKRRLRHIDFPVAYVGFGRMSTSGSP
jgi:hypothetical protein